VQRLPLYFNSGGFWSFLCANKSEIGSRSRHFRSAQLHRVLHTEETHAEYSSHCWRRGWLSIRLWTVWRSGHGAPANTHPVGKLIQFLHPGERQTKPPGRSAANHSSKAHPVAKKHASTQLASQESTSNGAPEVTPSELVIDGDATRKASLKDVNDIDVAANAQGTLESDAPSAAATVMNAVGPETMAPADKSNSLAAVVSQTPSSNIGSMSWLLRVIAALSGAMATGLLAWFLIEPSASADIWVRLSKS
jgi:hypothetical protein